MSTFYTLLKTWQSLPVMYNGATYKLETVEDDYLKLSKTGEDGLKDLTYLPIRAVSAVFDNNSKVGTDHQITRTLYAK